jgi:hypothetical protein
MEADSYFETLRPIGYTAGLHFPENKNFTVIEVIISNLTGL